MKTYAVIAHIRSRGSIGRFWDTVFTVESAEPAAVIEDWFRSYSDDYELHHIVSVREVCDGKLEECMAQGGLTSPVHGGAGGTAPGANQR